MTVRRWAKGLGPEFGGTIGAESETVMGLGAFVVAFAVDPCPARPSQRPKAVVGTAPDGASLGRTGLRGAVIWLGGGIIASSLSWGMNQVAPLFAILAVILLLATLSLLLPAQMARARLCEAKRAELARVRAKIARAKEAALSGGGEAREQTALLPGLLAYEARIESVREFVVVVGRHRAGLEFGSIDERPVHIVVLIAGPREAKMPYLELLAQLSKRLKLEEVRKQIADGTSPEEVVTLLVEG